MAVATSSWTGPERRHHQITWDGAERRHDGRSGSATLPAHRDASIMPRPGAVVTAAVVAAMVFAVMEMMLVAIVQGMPFWAPLHMIAAIVMGSGVLPPPPAFDLGVAAVAMGVHLVLSLVLATILAFVLLRTRPGSAWWIGLLFGIALYYINFYGFTALFPWFADARGWISWVSHAVFGLLLGVVYRSMDKRERPLRRA